MNADRWKKIEQLCYEAEGMEQPQRDLYLQNACGNDEELLAEVKSLLNQSDSERLREPFVDMESSFVFSEDQSLSERTIGPYRVIKTIGSGGMGQVFLAVRDDDQFERFVALKVIRKGLVSEDVLRRFYEERQILASLNHANIARLFDGGTAEDDMPWFAMEYIEGQPITDYCEAKNATIEEKIDLFLTVCSAVQHAHRNLVIHRDLKPENILITQDGTPKLLDFGIAKLKDLEQKAGQTQYQNRMMTPEYASPEQVRNESISTSSDVYSLGVLLYELLTRVLPYQFDKRSPAAIERTICNTMPGRPSGVANKKMLKGDLDSIILKALRKEPADRYASVEQFANDLVRYKKALPVVSRKETTTYRVKKFLSRHKWGAAVSVAIAVLLITFATVTLIQSQAIRERAVEAERQRDRAEQTNTFLTDLFESADPNEAENKSLTAIELLHRGADRVETKLNGQPRQQANVYLVISEVYEKLGLFDEGLDLAKKAYSLQQDLFVGNHREIARSLNAMGWLYRQKGDYKKADSLLTAGLKMRRELFGSDDLDVARSLNDLAVLKQNQGDYAAADTLLLEAIEIRKSLAGEQDQSVGTALSNYAVQKYRLGDVEGAAEKMREALDIFIADVGERDMRTANVMNNLAAILLSQGRFKEAEPLYEKTLEIRLQLLGEEHPDVANSYEHLGNLFRYKQEFEKAEPQLLRALQLRKKLLGENHADVADTKRIIGLLYSNIGNYPEAEGYYSDAIAIFRSVYPKGHHDTANALHLLGELYLNTNDYTRAELQFREAVELRERFFGSGDSRTVDSMIKLGVCLSRNGKKSESKSLLVSALEALEEGGEKSKALRTLAENTLAEM